MAVTSQELVDLINVFTQQSAQCHGPANRINVVSVAMAVAGQGPLPKVIDRLSDMTSTVYSNLGSCRGMTTFTSKADQDLILKAVKETISFETINVCPDVGKDLAKHKDSLDDIFGKAIDSWSGRPLTLAVR
ncbi:MAG: hypothetical protein M1824_004408 [Vezdaea acicularis]|nr:MAG: hypothetical protein M1824_004408 [Vezdaea acicularis]